MKGKIYVIVSAILFSYIIKIDFLSAQTKDLFEKDEIIQISISGDLSGLLNDRNGKAEYYPISLSYLSEDSTNISIPLRSRTRGNFRRSKDNCYFPPLFLNFSSKHDNGIFASQNKVKLVMPCRGDEYVLKEYYVYKLYNLISPNSFRVRLVKVVLDDPVLRPRQRGPFYAFLIEEEEQMAERNDMFPLNQKLIRPEQTERKDFLNMAVFEYLIGNTDWSVQYRQNVKLISADTVGKIIPVPYDFDHAGIVGAPYAKPAAALKLASIKIRRYRGYCIENMEHYDEVVAHYNNQKESIYKVYTDSELLDASYIKSTISYLDRFYSIINSPKLLKWEFQYPCNPAGTGNTVIKGLKDSLK